MMHGGDGMFTVFALLPLIIYLAVIIFGVYFVIKMVQFMDAKIKLDKEKNEKIDQLIQVIKQGKNE